MTIDAVDSGRVEGLTSADKRELIELRRKMRALGMENEILRRASAYFAGENLTKIASRIVREMVAQGFPVAHADRFGAQGDWGSRSGFYDWMKGNPPPGL